MNDVHTSAAVSWGALLWCSDVVRTHNVTKHDTPIHNILSTPQLSINQKALGTLPENDNVMLEHVGATIHNK
jgi:hypothetical protein